MDKLRHLLDFSLLNHSEILNRILNSKEAIQNFNEFDVVCKDINNLVTISRTKGLRALKTYSSETNDLFLKDMICFITEFISGETNDDLYDDVYYINKMILPHFLFSKLEVQEYLKDVIIYEALLLIISGTHPILIQYRINSILGKENHIQ